jgi:hypothetical protein
MGMKWYWKVRIYRPDGRYVQCEVVTPQELCHIDKWQDYYLELTGCKMLLEGMSEQSWAGLPTITNGFSKLWGLQRD